jgi:hypothetical protein
LSFPDLLRVVALAFVLKAVLFAFVGGEEDFLEAVTNGVVGVQIRCG